MPHKGPISIDVGVCSALSYIMGELIVIKWVVERRHGQDQYFAIKVHTYYAGGSMFVRNLNS